MTKNKRNYQIKVIAMKKELVNKQTIFKSLKEAIAGIKTSNNIEDFVFLRILGKSSQNLICEKCKYKVKNWHKFCLNCGNKL